MLLGARTLLKRETRRFMRVPGQTLLSPAVTTALYLVVFGFALGGKLREVGGHPYFDFIVPGLMMLGLVNNAFMNTSSSMMAMKITGSIVDVLVTPLSYVEITLAMVGAAVLRGLMVAFMTWLVAVVVKWHVVVAAPGYALAFPVLSAVGFGAIGLLTGIWAESFEQLNAVPAFILLPLVFLGGVFYDVHTLPPVLQAFTRGNPIFYVVDGMRYGLLGSSAVPPSIGLACLAAADVVVIGLCLIALRTGWKLRG